MTQCAVRSSLSRVLRADVTQWAVRDSLQNIGERNANVHNAIKGLRKEDLTQWAARISWHMLLGGGCKAAGCQMHLLKKVLGSGCDAVGCQGQRKDDFWLQICCSGS